MDVVKAWVWGERGESGPATTPAESDAREADEERGGLGEVKHVKVGQPTAVG